MPCLRQKQIKQRTTCTHNLHCFRRPFLMRAAVTCDEHSLWAPTCLSNPASHARASPHINSPAGTHSTPASSLSNSLSPLRDAHKPASHLSPLPPSSPHPSHPHFSAPAGGLMLFPFCKACERSIQNGRLGLHAAPSHPCSHAGWEQPGYVMARAPLESQRAAAVLLITSS